MSVGNSSNPTKDLQYVDQVRSLSANQSVSGQSGTSLSVTPAEIAAAQQSQQPTLNAIQTLTSGPTQIQQPVIKLDDNIKKKITQLSQKPASRTILANMMQNDTFTKAFILSPSFREEALNQVLLLNPADPKFSQELTTINKHLQTLATKNNIQEEISEKLKELNGETGENSAFDNYRRERQKAGENLIAQFKANVAGIVSGDRKSMTASAVALYGSFGKSRLAGFIKLAGALLGGERLENYLGGDFDNIGPKSTAQQKADATYMQQQVNTMVNFIKDAQPSSQLTDTINKAMANGATLQANGATVPTNGQSLTNSTTNADAAALYAAQQQQSVH